MPAHISIGDGFNAAGRFVNQALPGKYQTRGTFLTLEARSQKNHSWISPAFASSIPGMMRNSRETVCTTYDQYRAELDTKYFTKGAKGKGDGAYPWFREVGDPRGVDTFNLALGALGDGKERWDISGYQHFKKEWDLYLKKGTCFDLNVRARLLYGDTVTLIKRRGEARINQLKRIEANTAGKVIILWSIH